MRRSQSKLLFSPCERVGSVVHNTLCLSQTLAHITPTTAAARDRTAPHRTGYKLLHRVHRRGGQLLQVLAAHRVVRHVQQRLPPPTSHAPPSPTPPPRSAAPATATSAASSARAPPPRPRDPRPSASASGTPPPPTHSPTRSKAPRFQGFQRFQGFPRRQGLQEPRGGRKGAGN